MDEEFLSSSETSLEIPSIVEAISSSVNESNLIFSEFEKSNCDADSDNWAVAQQPDPYYQTYQPVQWNYQQNYSPYPQYGYMTPSPYNSYYMQSPPVDYQHQNYMYMQNYEQQPQKYTFVEPKSQDSQQNSCTVCLRSFKSASNLTRHFMSKTHLKRLETRKQNSNVTVVRVKKPKAVGSSFTDISKDEREFLWQLDDEIWSFLKVFEEEKSKKKLVLPTPPLSPKSVKNSVKSQKVLQRSNTVISIASSSPELNRLESVETPKSIISPRSVAQSISPPRSVGIIRTETPAQYHSPRSVTSSPAVLINEKGEKFEIIFSDENFGNSLS